MFKYFQTTTLILLWCLLLSFLWSLISYYWSCHLAKKSDFSHRSSLKNFAVSDFTVIPSLVVGPVLLVVFFNSFSINLLFPLHFFSSFFDLCLAAFFPAVVLLLASGLMGNVSYSVRSEYQMWKAKPFSLVATAFGQNPDMKIRRLVLLKSLSFSWSQCLPWVFGELIVIEAVFNAPGIGLDAWHMAKMRNMSGLIEAMLWMAMLYVFFVFVSNQISKWVGSRLETYG